MGKIKDFFRHLWDGLTRAGRIIFGILIIGLIILIGWLIARANNDEKTNDDNKPEVAQVYEPSIGSPLPPDVATDSTTVTATVAGDSTTVPSNDSPMVAPPTGIDPNEPVAYENSDFKFSAVLPAGTQVSEQKDSISFTSNGSLLYKVSALESYGENLQSIEMQLRNSPSVSNISSVKFAGLNALQFKAPQYGTGTAFISNGKVYYLFGNSKYFSTFKL